MNASRFATAMLSLGIVALLGCGGPKQAEVTGTVTLKNEPLEAGVVTFFPESGQPVAAFVQNGMYAIPAVVYGNYRISVAPHVESPEVMAGAGGPRKPGTVDPSAKAGKAKKPAAESPIPTKYTSADTSQLTCSVDQPKVTHPITLE